MSWKRWMAAVVLLGQVVVADEGVDELRVLCFNLRYINDGDRGDRTWTARRDGVAEVILEDKPDLIGIQEGLRPMLDDVQARVPGFFEIGGGREDGLAKGEAAPIFARADRFTVLKSGTFWLSDTPEVVASATWGNQVTRICTWAHLYDRKAKRELWFFNTHLDHESDLARANGVKLILQRIGETGAKGPFVFTGDFNALPENPLHEAIRTSPQGLKDVWLELNPEATAAESGTAHGFSGRKDGIRIDYVYASDSFLLVSAKVLQEPVGGIFPSDHYPVRVTLGYPGR
jgi:endonuclease/exonuclease/phosphatase family metal-dependent hydrolase